MVSGLTLLLTISFQTQTQSEATLRPNIIFILTDDQRWDALSCMGNQQARTPNIDRLAKEGVLFKNHFVTTSICCVSRASILTGQYARRHDINDFATPLTDDQWENTYPALLRKAGYRTGFIGKFGVGNAAAVNAMAPKFDYWKGVTGGGSQHFIEPNDPDRLHQTARFGGQALEFLQTQPPSTPFCLSISFTAPHARDNMPREYTPDDRDATLYASAAIPKPLTASEPFFTRLPQAVQDSVARRRWFWRFDTEEKFQNNVKDYYRLVAGIDREVGRIMHQLASKGIADNTVIVFTSDNGYFLGERQLAGKWFMYEESIRDPLIVFDPRQPATQRNRSENAITLNIDFAPTILALAGVESPATMQGQNLIPFLKGNKPKEWRSDFFYEHHFGPNIIPPSEGVRTENWSYIRWTNEDPLIEELYDIQRDPLQVYNLINDPAHKATLDQLRARWNQFRKDLE